MRTHRIVDGAPPPLNDDTDTRVKQKKRHRKEKTKEKKKDKKVCTTPRLSQSFRKSKLNSDF